MPQLFLFILYFFCLFRFDVFPLAFLLFAGVRGLGAFWTPAGLAVSFYLLLRWYESRAAVTGGRKHLIAEVLTVTWERHHCLFLDQSSITNIRC